jgi:hypothetical protein
VSFSNEMNDDFLNSIYRFKLIEVIKNNMNHLDYGVANKQIKDLFDEITKENKKTEFMNNLLIDLINDDDNHGQVEKAFSEKYFNKWGINYLYSFLRFHILEQCGNFKDQSLQLYQGKDFEKYRKKGNKIFINLPPPENNVPQYDHNYSISNQPNINKMVSISSLRRNNFIDLCYNSRGGCFTDAIIDLKDGKKKKISELKKGDILKNGAVVECLVVNEVNHEEDAVEINGIFLSPYHPIFINGKWEFPCHCGKIVKKLVDKWYNLVLENIHEIQFGEFNAITLGHNRNDNDIVKHPYFGTNKVIIALKKYDTYKDGIVITKNIKFHRDCNNLVDEYY